MAHEPVGAFAHQRLVFQRNDPRGPEGSTGCDEPDARELENNEEGQTWADNERGPRNSEHDHREPGGVQKDDEQVVPATNLGGAACQQRFRVALRVQEFDEALQRHQRRNDIHECGHAGSRTRKAHEKPGPSADSSVRCFAFRQFMRSSTKSAVAADMLPKSVSTERLSARPPWDIPSASSNASNTFAPPGWQAKLSNSERRKSFFCKNSSTILRKSCETMLGMLWANFALSPSSSTSQPMTSSEPGQVYSPQAPKGRPAPRVERIAPAAPSPNKAVATTLLLDKSFLRNVSAQSSTTRKRILAPGIARAS